MTPAEFITWRKALGLTQATAAVALGVTVKTVSRWECGERKPTPERSIRLAMAAIDRRIDPWSDPVS